MTDFKILGNTKMRVLFISVIIAAAVLVITASLRFSTYLNGIPRSDINIIDTGWLYEDESGGTVEIPSLPCELEHKSDTLYLTHSLSDTQQKAGNVLAFQTRYQSIRIWADVELIYEAAQGREHALSSMWHFIPYDDYIGASVLRVELTQYDGSSEWKLFSVYSDNSSRVEMHIIRQHIPTILVWMCCMLFSLLLIFVIVFMAIKKIAQIPLIVSLAAFIFISGMWILLDSKVTTIYGGNYAFTYFLSYFVFYLLPIPLLFYFQFILELKNRFLLSLIWITAGNFVICMLLHLLGIVHIRNTSITVHLIIVVFLVSFIYEFFKKSAKIVRKKLICSFCGIAAIFAAGLVSIFLYHADLLPPANSALVYAWCLLILLLCMTMDAILTFFRIWKERQYIEFYRQLATFDSKTNIKNRNAYELRLRKLVGEHPSELCFIIFDVDNMKQINDTYGHHAGDEVLTFIAECIQKIFADHVDCYRIGGDEFCVIITDNTEISERLYEFDKLIKQNNKNKLPVSVSYGWSRKKFSEDSPITSDDLYEIKNSSDKMLYMNKNTRL